VIAAFMRTYYTAMRLWEQIRRSADEEFLKILLEYNREDTVNLYYLEDYLARIGKDLNFLETT
jgi:uncharacterized protein YprB with RNaseH-like and TPR domain